MRVGERPRKMPAFSPKTMRLQEDASRVSTTPFGPVGPGPSKAQVASGVKKSKGQPQTSLNLGIGKGKRGKRND